jgi:hypothetical protein
MRVAVAPPQELADEHTLIAQKYAGYFLGHPFRAAQQKTGPGAIVVDQSRAWCEPAVITDDCGFCCNLTDEEAVRRVAGYQHAIDIEVIRPYAAQYGEWLATSPAETEHVDLGGETTLERGVMNSAINRRRFLESRQQTFQHQAISMVDLPLRLKRKLCIEWNHLYRAWMEEQDLQYDRETREFYREGPDRVPASELAAGDDLFAEWWRGVATQQATGGVR